MKLRDVIRNESLDNIRKTYYKRVDSSSFFDHPGLVARVVIATFAGAVIGVLAGAVTVQVLRWLGI